MPLLLLACRHSPYVAASPERGRTQSTYCTTWVRAVFGHKDGDAEVVDQPGQSREGLPGRGGYQREDRFVQGQDALGEAEPTAIRSLWRSVRAGRGGAGQLANRSRAS